MPDGKLHRAKGGTRHKHSDDTSVHSHAIGSRALRRLGRPCRLFRQRSQPVISQEQVDNASVSIRVGKVTGTGISSVELVVSASDMDEIREELTFVDDEATGSLSYLQA